jgi:hypothetical protein
MRSVDRWKRKLAASAEHLWRWFGLLADPLVLHAASWVPHGFVARSASWRAAWLGAAEINRDDFRRSIDETYRHVTDVLRQNLDLPAPSRSVVYIVIGEAAQLRETLALFPAYLHQPREERLNFFCAPSLVFVGERPGSPGFETVLAHELCHALGFQIRGGRDAAPWIDEGAAEFTARRAASRTRDCDPALFLTSGLREPTDFRLPATLRSLLSVGSTIDEGVSQGALTWQAGLLLHFLWQCRGANPQGWEMVRRAFAGLEPEATLPIRSFERAFDCSLEDIEEMFRCDCVRLLDRMKDRFQSARTRHLKEHENTN